ncbi:MAG: extracellular solute-binding protein [Thaumarchaeota archaeon]|nr:extracellular solute-binding protein [Nitrososphaerota archaeon]
MRTRRGVSTTVVIGAVVIIVIIVIGAFVLLSQPVSTTSSTTSTTTPQTSSTTSSMTTSTGVSSASSTTSSTSTITNPADVALYAAAKTEGSVVVYGSPTAQQFGNITAAFNAIYPGITVTYTSYQPPQAVPLINSQLATQGYSADVALQAATTMYPLEQSGDISSYVSPFAVGFPKEVLDPLNGSTPIIELALGWMYNTNLIKPANVPTTMAQVANAQFKGEVVMNDPTTGTAFTQYWATLEKQLGNATVLNFLHSLKNTTSPTILPTTTSCATDVAGGAHAICLAGYMQEAAPDIQVGAPLKFLNITGLPLLITPNNAAVVKNAQHPNAAKLLIDFMASPAGQTAWGNIDVRTPVSQTVNANWSLASELKSFDPGAGTQVYYPTPAVAAAGSAWGATFAFIKQ